MASMSLPQPPRKPRCSAEHGYPEFTGTLHENLPHFLNVHQLNCYDENNRCKNGDWHV